MWKRELDRDTTVQSDVAWVAQDFADYFIVMQVDQARLAPRQRSAGAGEHALDLSTRLQP